MSNAGNNGASNMTQTSLFSAARNINAAAKAPKAAAPKASEWKIEIEFSENSEISRYAGRAKTWTSFEDFTAMIAKHNHTAPLNCGYHKTYVEITHLDSGERYDLRLDVTHPEARDTSDNDLLERVRSMCAYMLDRGAAAAGPLGRQSSKELDAARAEWTKWSERFAAVAE